MKIMQGNGCNSVITIHKRPWSFSVAKHDKAKESSKNYTCDVIINKEAIMICFSGHQAHSNKNCNCPAQLTITILAPHKDI